MFFCPRCLGVGQHRCGCVLSATEPICGFGVDSDGLELCRGEAQNLGTPKHPCRASENEISSVCSGIAQLPDALRSLPPFDDERPPGAQL